MLPRITAIKTEIGPERNKSSGLAHKTSSLASGGETWPSAAGGLTQGVVSRPTGHGCSPSPDSGDVGGGEDPETDALCQPREPPPPPLFPPAA